MSKELPLSGSRAVDGFLVMRTVCLRIIESDGGEIAIAKLTDDVCTQFKRKVVQIKAAIDLVLMLGWARECVMVLPAAVEGMAGIDTEPGIRWIGPAPKPGASGPMPSSPSDLVQIARRLADAIEGTFHAPRLRAGDDG